MKTLYKIISIIGFLITVVAMLIPLADHNYTEAFDKLGWVLVMAGLIIITEE